MAYTFDATDDYVNFANSPLLGYTFGAVTFAAFVKRASLGSISRLIVSVADSGFSNARNLIRFSSANVLQLATPAGSVSGPTLSSSAVWYLIVVTRPAGTSQTVRFHVHDGSSWSHTNGGTTASDIATAVAGTDNLRVAAWDGASLPLGADVVCAGIKKTDSADLTVETLSRTSFDAWRSFGFDWLIGFDSSLKVGGILQDQASPGTGDQIAVTGTTPVADPAGWVWTAAVTPVADFTGTPLSGVASLSVTFTDASTNTPTSWAWTFGDGGTSSSQNPTHSYTTPGTYTVVLVATNAAGSNTKTRTGYVYVTVGETILYAAGGGIEIY